MRLSIEDVAPTLVARLLCATLVLSAPVATASACGVVDYPASDSNLKEMKRYNGHKDWDPRRIYPAGSDFQLGVPHNVGLAYYGPWFDVEGRKVRQVFRQADGIGKAVFQCHRIYGRNTQGHAERRPITRSNAENEISFQGLEDDKGKVILPTVFRQVRIIPGRGVFVMSHLGDQTYEHYSLASGVRTPAVDVAEIVDNGLTGEPWRVGVYTMQPVANLSPTERAKPWRQQQRPASLEVFDDAGALVLKRENLQPQDKDLILDPYGRSQWIGHGLGKRWPAPMYALPGISYAPTQLQLISYDIVPGSPAHELLDLSFRPIVDPLPDAPVRVVDLKRLPPADYSGWMLPLPVGAGVFVPISKAGRILPPQAGSAISGRGSWKTSCSR